MTFRSQLNNRLQEIYPLNMLILSIRIPEFMHSKTFNLEVRKGEKIAIIGQNRQWQNHPGPADSSVL